MTLAEAAKLRKGDKVIVALPMLNGREFAGEVVANGKRGVRVRYDYFGPKFTETFYHTQVRSA